MSRPDIIAQHTGLPHVLAEVVDDFCVPTTFQGPASLVNTLVVSRDNKYLYSGSDHNIIRQWSLETGQLLQSFQGHTQPVCCLVLSFDNKHLYSGSFDHTIRQWAVGNEPVSSSLQSFKGHTGYVLCLAISLDNQYLYSASSDSTIRKWFVGKDPLHLTHGTGQLLQRFKNYTDSVLGLAVSSNGKFLYSSSVDNTIRQWSIETGQCLQIFQGHTDWVRSLVVSSDNQYLYSGSDDHTIRQWFVGHEPVVPSLENSPSHIRDTKKPLRIFQGHTSWVFNLSISPDNKYLCSGSADQTIRVWNTSYEPNQSHIQSPQVSKVIDIGWAVCTLVCTSRTVIYSYDNEIRQLLLRPVLDSVLDSNKLQQ